MKLHDCQMAPNPRRARIFLAEKGLEVEKVEHSILGGETCGPEYLKINAWGTVPALELDDGTVIRECPAIFRRVEPYPAPTALGERMAAKRPAEGRSMDEAARAIGIDEGTWRKVASNEMDFSSFSEW